MNKAFDNRKTLLVRIDEALHDKIKAEAANNVRSVNAEIAVLLQSAVARRETDAGLAPRAQDRRETASGTATATKGGER